MKNLAVIFCLPLSDFPFKPDDISAAEPVNCPDCKQKMWFSEKKKAYKALCEQLGKDILFCCGNCLKEKFKTMKENGELDETTEFHRIDI